MRGIKDSFNNELSTEKKVMASVISKVEFISIAPTATTRRQSVSRNSDGRFALLPDNYIFENSFEQISVP